MCHCYVCLLILIILNEYTLVLANFHFFQIIPIPLCNRVCVCVCVLGGRFDLWTAVVMLPITQTIKFDVHDKI